ncbi:MAG: adenine deaminase [bacterium]|nr:adenine deaminase [bacterium]
MSLPELLAVARGEKPADLVLRNLRLIDVLTGEIRATEVAVAGGLIAGVGSGYHGETEIDLGGRYVSPGLIDAHVHIESSLTPPSEFARAVVPRGVTTVITDPHEIANVRGLEGIRFMLRDAERVPLEIFVNAPSCVPASPLATSGASLDAEDLAELQGEPRLLGLAEVMSFPGVVAGDSGVLAKLAAFAGRVIDGHCPGLSGQALAAYAAAGISSDHESTSESEAREKLRQGLTLFIREATGARNLDALLPLVSLETERRICWCTDDRQPGDLLGEGSIDHLVRRAIGGGLDPMTAIRLATLNPAEHYRLSDRGAVAPGRRADLMVFEGPREPRAEQVYIGGQLVGEDGEPRFDRGTPNAGAMRDTVCVDIDSVEFRIPMNGTTPSREVRVIGIVPDQLITEARTATVGALGGFAAADPGRDLLRIAVVERHRGTGNVGRGFVQGLGLKRGAIAGTVAHDHHNLIVAGVDERSMATAARAVAEAGGGLAAAAGEQVLSLLPLPIAGLMSDQPIEEVREKMDELLDVSRELGSTLAEPFMALSFLGLEVIPSLKLTDLGLVDVDRFELVPLIV